MNAQLEIGIQLTDKYDLYSETCDYFNSHTLFHKGFNEIQTKEAMIKDATWKYRQKTASGLPCCDYYENERGIRIGLCLCISLTFIISILIIIASQDALHIIGFIFFMLVTICLFICFLIRANDYIKEFGLHCNCDCCRNKYGYYNKDTIETMISIDDYKLNFAKSKGLYFDEKMEIVYDIAIIANYSENTENEVIYIEHKQKLFDFKDLIEIGFNEVSNEPDWSEYGVYDSLPSVSYNKNDDDYCTLILKYRDEENKGKNNHNSLKPKDALKIDMNKSKDETPGISRWTDLKLSKGEYKIKLQQLRQILNQIGLSEQVTFKDKPYKKVTRNPVMKL